MGASVLARAAAPRMVSRTSEDARAYICYIAFMAQSPPVVLTIAGFDPSSGAGVTADVKTIAAHGCYGVGCITALTVQSTAGVRRLEAVSPELVADTLTELQSDLEILAVHIGMLASGKVAREVTGFLEKAGLPNIVLDPIIKSSSGHDLIDAPPSDRTATAPGHGHHTQCGRSGGLDRICGQEPRADAGSCGQAPRDGRRQCGHHRRPPG